MARPICRRWYTTGQARGAGMDPGFETTAVYNAPLWLAGSADSLIGRELRLQMGRATKGHHLAMDHGRATPTVNVKDAMTILEESDALFTDFTAARADIARRMPLGLQEAGSVVPIVLCPKSYGDASFDDIAQIYRVPIAGTRGETLDLILSSEDDANWLLSQSTRIKGILCEATFAELQLRFSPITIHLVPNKDETPSVCNLTLDTACNPASAGALEIGSRTLSFLKRSLTTVPMVRQDPIREVCLQSLDAIAETLRFENVDALAKVRQATETYGLKSLDGALGALAETGTVHDGLRSSYIAAELSKFSSIQD